MTGLSLSLAPVRDHFAAALNRRTVADLELVISELVSNSVEHGRGSIELTVEHSVAAIQGSVTDKGDGFAYTPPDLTSHAPRGRGLAIVEALVTRWGIRHGSTQVWFEITLNASPPIAPS